MGDDELKLEVEPVAPRPKPVARAVVKERPPRAGCTCKKRYDLYLDNDFGSLAGMLGGGIGIFTVLLLRTIGVLGTATMALGLAGLGGLATIISICFRCEGCRQRITDLDRDEREDLRKGRGLVVLVTLALFAGAAICGGMWWKLVKAKGESVVPALHAD